MKKLILILFCFLSSLAYTQVNWENISTTNKTNNTLSNSFAILKVDFFAFKNTISHHNAKQSKIISLPNEKGELIKFKITEAPVFSKSLSKRYPSIKSYVGYSIKNTSTIVRMSVTPKGIETTILSKGKEPIFMEPVNNNINKYKVYKTTPKNHKRNLKCSTNHTKSLTINTFKSSVNNNKLKKIRIAISVTGEYTQYHGGTKELAFAAINNTMTRVNAVYERDLAVRLIVQDLPQIVYTNPNTDPYTTVTNNEAPDEWGLELQNNLTNTIGNGAYDIGHLFGASGGGGNANCIGCVCKDDTPLLTDKNKGAAYSSPANGKPEGPFFDIDFVSHEIGHQLGANHTFSYETEGTNVNVEPASGSTIMAYAGILGKNNVTLESGYYFHYYSIQQINNTLNKTRLCWQNNNPEDINNTPPNVNAGDDYHIPKGTAYKLTGKATDKENDNLFYCWEQIDNGKVTYETFGPNLIAGATARSLPPTDKPYRYIPKLENIVKTQLTEETPTITSSWETVTNKQRDLNWALTVRDRSLNNAKFGQTGFDTMKITVTSGAPFKVNTVDDWLQFTDQTITWNVGSTNKLPINCKLVTIKLSTDGGITFDKVLVESTENDGSEFVILPQDIPASNNAYIMVEAKDNIFLAVSNKFTIKPNTNIQYPTVENFNLYPNPSKGEFVLKLKTQNDDNISLKLFDIRGQLIEEQNLVSSNNIFYNKLTLKNANPGLYLLQISNGGKQATKKIIIKN